MFCPRPWNLFLDFLLGQKQQIRLVGGFHSEKYESVGTSWDDCSQSILEPLEPCSNGFQTSNQRLVFGPSLCDGRLWVSCNIHRRQDPSFRRPIQDRRERLRKRHECRKTWRPAVVKAIRNEVGAVNNTFFLI